MFRNEQFFAFWPLGHGCFIPFKQANMGTKPAPSCSDGWPARLHQPHRGPAIEAEGWQVGTYRHQAVATMDSQLIRDSGSMCMIIHWTRSSGRSWTRSSRQEPPTVDSPISSSMLMSPVWMASKLASFTEASASSRAQKQKLKNKLHLVYSQGCCQFSQPDDKALVEAILACEIACFFMATRNTRNAPPRNRSRTKISCQRS